MATLIKVPTLIDERGSLTVIDQLLPFDIKRIFYIYDVAKKRGGHRHKTNKMCLIALNGSIEIHVQTPIENLVFTISSPDEVLVLEPEDWHTMDNFSKGSTLLVLNSHSWSKDDYIYEAYRVEAQNEISNERLREAI
ncbi:MAG: FdtA/QdtA family cupin domain-containing protein [Bdellovibrionales bacterium]|nr:FdtA/QdtA family cupin domain-containing protein [Bdellovibrionales bacterium]